MKKILVSLSLIVAVGAVVVGATGAFFSDTETSVGNTFTAGDIDLKIDNESYAIDYNIPGFNNPQGNFVASAHTSWELVDLTVEKFFDFIDLKPGDYGEDTISIHVGSNDAWVCAAAQITEDEDNSITEPEDAEAGANNDNDDGTLDGDLDTELQFAFWVDDGDNVLEEDEVTNIFLEGTLADMGAQGQITLADSANSILGGNDPIPGDTTFYIAKAWCFGDLAANPIAQDSEGKLPNSTNGPLVRGTGVSCDGSGAGNIAQTDSVVGDITFYAEQARNNGEFLCSAWDPDFPLPPEEPGTLTLEKEVIGDGDSDPADTEWLLEADSGSLLIDGPEGDADVTNAVVPADDYLLAESGGPGGFSQTDLQCTGGTLVGTTVTVDPAADVVCTFTNTEESTITVLKVVEPGSDTSPAVEGDFAPYLVDATEVTLGDPTVFAAGAYSVSESGSDEDYIASFSGDCDEFGDITLGIGEDLTCTITNTFDGV